MLLTPRPGSPQKGASRLRVRCALSLGPHNTRLQVQGSGATGTSVWGQWQLCPEGGEPRVWGYFCSTYVICGINKEVESYHRGLHATGCQMGPGVSGSPVTTQCRRSMSRDVRGGPSEGHRGDLRGRDTGGREGRPRRRTPWGREGLGHWRERRNLGTPAFCWTPDVPTNW